MPARHSPIKCAIYFAVSAFGVGFAFGALRETVLIPMIGKDAGTILEFIIMLLAVLLVAFKIVHRFEIYEPKALLITGIVGTILLIGIESAFAMGILRQPLEVYLSHFDISAGALFPFGLIAMAISPLLAGTILHH